MKVLIIAFALSAAVSACSVKSTERTVQTPAATTTTTTPAAGTTTVSTPAAPAATTTVYTR